MNLGELKQSVKRQFGDESAVQITDADILNWSNQAIIDAVMQNDDLLQAVSTTNLVQGQTAYTPPTDLLGLRGVSVKSAVDQAYYSLKGLNLQDFNQWMDGWDGNYYGPNFAYAYMYYNGIITIFPSPNTSQTDGIKIYYNRYPTQIANDSDEIPLPKTYHNSILDYCIQKAYELDENWEGAGNKAAQVTSSQNVLKERQEWGNMDTYPVINVRAEDAW